MNFWSEKISARPVELRSIEVGSLRRKLRDLGAIETFRPGGSRYNPQAFCGIERFGFALTQSGCVKLEFRHALNRDPVIRQAPSLVEFDRGPCLMTVARNDQMIGCGRGLRNQKPRDNQPQPHGLPDESRANPFNTGSNG